MRYCFLQRRDKAQRDALHGAIWAALLVATSCVGAATASDHESASTASRAVESTEFGGVPFFPQIPGEAHNLTVVEDTTQCVGNPMARFELRPGETWDEGPRPTHRSEFTSSIPTPIARDTWYRVKLRTLNVPRLTDAPAQFFTVAQWHGVRDQPEIGRAHV